MKYCIQCERNLPLDKFNADCGSPDHCFKCRVSSVRLGFGGHRQAFHGDTLVGGTIRSDNKATVDAARANGYDPVPAEAPGVGVSSGELSRLKKVHGNVAGGGAK